VTYWTKKPYQRAS